MNFLVIKTFFGSELSIEQAKMYLIKYHKNTYEKLSSVYGNDWQSFLRAECRDLRFDDKIEFTFNDDSEAGILYFLIFSDIYPVVDLKKGELLSGCIPKKEYFDHNFNKDRYKDLKEKLGLQSYGICIHSNRS